MKLIVIVCSCILMALSGFASAEAEEGNVDKLHAQVVSLFHLRGGDYTKARSAIAAYWWDDVSKLENLAESLPSLYGAVALSIAGEMKNPSEYDTVKRCFYAALESWGAGPGTNARTVRGTLSGISLPCFGTRLTIEGESTYISRETDLELYLKRIEIRKDEATMRHYEWKLALSLPNLKSTFPVLLEFASLGCRERNLSPEVLALCAKERYSGDPSIYLAGTSLTYSPGYKDRQIIWDIKSDRNVVFFYAKCPLIIYQLASSSSPIVFMIPYYYLKDAPDLSAEYPKYIAKVETYQREHPEEYAETMRSIASILSKYSEINVPTPVVRPESPSRKPAVDAPAPISEEESPSRKTVLCALSGLLVCVVALVFMVALRRSRSARKGKGVK